MEAPQKTRQVCWLLASVSAISLVAAGSSAFAQEQDSVEDELGIPIEQITVTGSRIHRGDYTLTQPIITTDSEIAFKRGFDNIAQALNEIPSFGLPGNDNIGSQGNFRNDNSAPVGQQFINFFGLGAQRTLVVIDGKRVVSQMAPSFDNAGQQVDLNIIPKGIIDRVETLTIGGSPIYGSDAVAGTVNIILKDNFEGIMADGRGTITERGDGAEQQFELVVGGNFAEGRGNAIAAFQFTNIESLLFSDRPGVFRGVEFVTRAFDGDEFVPEGATTGLCAPDCNNFNVFTRGGAPSADPRSRPPRNGGLLGPNGFPLVFAPDSTLIEVNPGQSVTGVSARGGNCCSQNTDEFTLRSQQERFNFFGKAHYDFADNLRFGFESLVSISDTFEPKKQPLINLGNFAFEEAPIPIRLSNGFISDSVRAQIAPLLDLDGDGTPDQALDLDGDGIPEEQGFFLSRHSADIINGGPNRFEQTVYMFRAGFEGDFEFAGRKFDWDITSTFGRTESNSVQPRAIDDRFFDAVDAVEVDASQAQAINDALGTFGLNVAPGDVVCRSQFEAGLRGGPPVNAAGHIDDDFVKTNIAGCVPLNILGDEASSQEARDFVVLPFTNLIRVQQLDIVGSITGKLFEMPWNDESFSFAVGFEHRRDKAGFFPGAGELLSPARLEPNRQVGGDVDTSEGFLEGLVPVVMPDMEIPFVESFELEGAVRYIASDLSGDARTWTVGSRLRFTQDLMVRGNFTRSVRAPSIGEAFAPNGSNRAVVADPCDLGNIGRGANPEVRRRNCQALFDEFETARGEAIDVQLETPGLQTGLENFVGFAQTRPLTLSGNRDLENETADSYTIGAVITPRWVTGLSLSLDYVDIEMKNVIFRLDGTSISNSCFDDPDFEQLCDRVFRDADFQIRDAIQSFENIGFRNFQAIIASGNYNFRLADFGLPDWGSVDIGINYQFLDQLETSVLGTGEDINRDNGELGAPDHSMTANVDYNFGPFSFFWQSEWIAGTVVNRDEPDGFRFPAKIPSSSLHNMSFSYDILDNLTFRVAVSNVFDRHPTLLEQAALDEQSGDEAKTFDALGRRWDFGLRFRY